MSIAALPPAPTTSPDDDGRCWTCDNGACYLCGRCPCCPDDRLAVVHRFRSRLAYGSDGQTWEADR